MAGVLGFRGARWWRRALSLVAIPLTLVCALIVLNEWVGYYPTLQRAWGDLTSGPLPDEIDAKDLPGLRNTHPDTGKVVGIETCPKAEAVQTAGGTFYLPHTSSADDTPPQLPAVMVNAGQISIPTELDTHRQRRMQVIEQNYAAAASGRSARIRFRRLQQKLRMTTTPNPVNGPRGRALEPTSLTKEAPPYVILQFEHLMGPLTNSGVLHSVPLAGHVPSDPRRPCALNIFTTYEDIEDNSPNQIPCTKRRTDQQPPWSVTPSSHGTCTDPRTVMAKHGPYSGVAGYFDDSQEPADDKTKNLPDRRQDHLAPVGFGGNGDEKEFREKGALPDLCAAAVAVNVKYTLRVYTGYHTWQFGVARSPTPCHGLHSGCTHQWFLIDWSREHEAAIRGSASWERISWAGRLM